MGNHNASFLRVAGLLLLLAAIGASLALVPVKEWISDVIAWVRDLGFWGPVLLAAVYVPACLLFIPGSLLTLGAGFAFGVVRGTIAVWAGGVLAAAAAFLLGRTLARGLIEQRVARNPRFRAIDQAVGREGFKVVLLLRLSPVFPFGLLNYALGLTKVSFRDYLAASAIGILPGTIMYVYIGSVAGMVVSEGEASGPRIALLIVGLLATVAVTILLTRIAREALKGAIPEVDTAPDG